MEFKIICPRVCLLIIFFCLSWTAVAQTKDNNDKKLLLGEWLWDETTIADDKWPISLDLGNDYIRFYDEIEIGEEIVLIKDVEEPQKLKYEINGNYVGLNLPSGESFIAEWTIFKDKLYLEFDSFHPYDTSKEVKVLLVYRKK